MTNLSPILLFTYKRLDTLKLTVDALRDNYLSSESDLFIFSDAAKGQTDIQIVEEVRTYLKTISGFKRVVITEASHNKGLANSIIDGVSSVINTYGRVIVLEDDLKTTPNFLDYMNACLNRYQDTSSVFSVSAYSFNLGLDPLERNDTYYLSRGWSWGWGTWANQWNDTDWSVSDYNKFVTNKIARAKFALGGSDLNDMLDKQMTGKLDSWAIRWFYHQFKISGLTVYPILSKIYNNGFDDDATHTTGSSQRYLPLMDKDLKREFNFPTTNQVSKYYQMKFQQKMGIRARLLSKLQTIFKKIF